MDAPPSSGFITANFGLYGCPWSFVFEGYSLLNSVFAPPQHFVVWSHFLITFQPASTATALSTAGKTAFAVQTVSRSQRPCRSSSASPFHIIVAFKFMVVVFVVMEGAALSTARVKIPTNLEYDSDSMPHRPEIPTAKRTMELSAQVKPPFAFQPCA
jgi:hypothetical protein